MKKKPIKKENKQIVEIHIFIHQLGQTFPQFPTYPITPTNPPYTPTYPISTC